MVKHTNIATVEKETNILKKENDNTTVLEREQSIKKLEIKVKTLKENIEKYQTGYQVRMIKNKMNYIDHEKKIIYLSTRLYREFPFFPSERGLERRLYDIIAEIELYQQGIHIYDYMFKKDMSWEQVKEIRTLLNRIHFHTGIKKERIERSQTRFLKRMIMKYDSYLEREKIVKQYDVHRYEKIVQNVVAKSGCFPVINYEYRKIEHEDGYVLGCYSYYQKDTKSKELDEMFPEQNDDPTHDAKANDSSHVERESEEIEIYVGNILHIYQNRKHLYESEEEFIEAVATHETGHMVKKDNLYNRKIDIYYQAMMVTIEDGNEEKFREMFIHYCFWLLKEEKRAWNQGEAYYITETYRKKMKTYKIHSLRGYLPCLRKRKERWLRELRENKK